MPGIRPLPATLFRARRQLQVQDIDSLVASNVPLTCPFSRPVVRPSFIGLKVLWTPLLEQAVDGAHLPPEIQALSCTRLAGRRKRAPKLGADTFGKLFWCSESVVVRCVVSFAQARRSKKGAAK